MLNPGFLPIFNNVLRQQQQQGQQTAAQATGAGAERLSRFGQATGGGGDILSQLQAFGMAEAERKKQEEMNRLQSVAPSPGLLQRLFSLFGSRGDIMLPNESGMIDPRLR